MFFGLFKFLKKNPIDVGGHLNGKEMNFKAKILVSRSKIYEFSEEKLSYRNS